MVKNSDKLSKENIDLIQSVEALEGKNTELQRNNDELSNLLSSLRKQYTVKRAIKALIHKHIHLGKG